VKIAWFKSIQARLSAKIEGRNVIIAIAIVFCGFGLWIFIESYNQHPAFSIVFCSILMLLSGSTIFVGLLAQPRASDITNKYFMHLFENDLLLGGGFQAPSEIIDFLKAAHEIRELPPPSGIVKGSASNEADHQRIDKLEAARMALEDKLGVEEMLGRETQQILTGIKIKQRLSGLTPSDSSSRRESEGESKENAT